MNENPTATDAPLPRFRIAPVLTGLVLLLAVMLASVPARNSDVWRHLATGRALLLGNYTLGTDPFAYTTDGVTWVNHAWLYDAILYLVYEQLGDELVLWNVLLAGVLAGLLLLAARPAVGIGTVATAVALIAIGPHLALGPSVLSYVFFAFTLGWLQRDRGKSTLRDHVLLFLVFVLWANCDAWFLLGPLTVGLFCVGTALAARSDQAACPLPPAVFVVSFLVCLLNPHHVQAFWPSVLMNAPDGAAWALYRLLGTPPAAFPAPVLAYALLAVLGLASFLAPAPRPWPQVIVILALLALSLACGAAIPFFAIACGPFIARRWQTAATRATSWRRPWLGNLAAMALLTGLVVLACPGWLQGVVTPRSWRLHADPSLRALARQMSDQHRAGDLGPEARGFHLSVDAAHYFEWFCPGAKVFFDGRTNLFPAAVVADFIQVRQALADESGARADADPILRRWGVTYLVVADSSERTLSTALRHLWQAPAEWSFISLEGRAGLFARSSPGQQALSLARRAFDPTVAQTAPPQWPGREPQPRAWWDWFGVAESAGALDRDKALVALMYFEALRPGYLDRNRALWEASVIAGLLGTAPYEPGLCAIGGSLRLALLAASRQPVPSTGATPFDLLVFRSIAAHMQRRDDGPPGVLLLAVRAARRALHADPDDASAYLRLGRAYERLNHHTAERGEGFALLTQLRRLQAIVALQNALRLQPDLLSGHELLAQLYQEAGALDLALPHREAQLRLGRAAGPRPGETAPQFAARIEAVASRAKSLGMQVRELLNLVDTQSFDRDVYTKAHLAESRGLPARALALLLGSNYETFGREGAVLQFHLLLLAGRPAEVRAWMEPKQEPAMGTFNYRWLQVLLGAATGDYDPAADDLRRLVVLTVAVPELGLRATPPRTAVGLLLGQHLLRGASLDPWQMRERPDALLTRLHGLARVPHQQADFHTLRGLLALEVGAIEVAREAFTSALAAWAGPDGSAGLARHELGFLQWK